MKTYTLAASMILAVMVVHAQVPFGGTRTKVKQATLTPTKVENPPGTTNAAGSNMVNSVFTLVSVSIQVTTGSDPKVQGSNVEFELAADPYNLFESLYNNIAFPTGTGNVINLTPRPGTAPFSNLDNFRSGGRVDIFFRPSIDASGGVIAALTASDKWIITDVKIILKFRDQNNNESPYTIEFKNIATTLMTNQQRLRLPFVYNGTEFLAGGAHMPR